MNKTAVRLISVILVLLFCLGCRSVSVICDVSEIDLSAVEPEPDNPNNYIGIVRHAPIPTDRGIFRIVREEDADYVSFLTDEGEDVRLLKGTCFANLQLVQPYLYVVDFGTRDLSDAYSYDYAKLYRLDLSDRSLSCFPRYTYRYYALSSGEILRINSRYAGCFDLLLSDWQGVNSRALFSGRFPDNPLPQGDTVVWFHFDPAYEAGVGDDIHAIRFTTKSGVDAETVWTDTEGSARSNGIFLYGRQKYQIVKGHSSFYEDGSILPVTVYALSGDGSRTVLLQFSCRDDWRLYPKQAFGIFPENAASRIIDTVHPHVVCHEPLENGLCLLGIASDHEIEIYTFDRIASYFDVADGTEMLIPLDEAK